MGDLFNRITAALIDGADALLLGIPSSVLLRDIADDYRADFKQVQEIYNKLNVLINAHGIERDKIAENKNMLLNEAMNYAPMSGLRASLNNEVTKLSAKESGMTTEISKLSKQAMDAEHRMNEIQHNMGKSLGTEAKERLLE